MAGQTRQKREEAIVLALARGEAHADAARAAGVSARTVQRRLHDTAFRQRISALRSQLVERAAGRLADGAVEAVDTLRALLADPSPTVRLGAARAMLEHTIKVREAGELVARLDQLEERLRVFQ